MLVDASVPGTDDWYLVRLCNQLGAGLPRMNKLQKYRDGDALIPLDLTAGERESYVRFMRRSRLHVVETLRDARTNRQKVIGFRTGAPDDEAGDVQAWRHWKTSAMQVQSRTFFNDTADFGSAYSITFRENDGQSVWQIRNGWDTTSIQDANRPWLTEAGLSVGFDPINQAEIAILFRPGYYRMAYRSTAVPTLPRDGTPWYGTLNWDWTDRIYPGWTNQNMMVRNQTPDGLGIYEKHLDTVDRINEITLNGLSLIVQQAYRQRWVEGKMPEVYPQGHPRAGEKIDYDELFAAGPAALWFLGDGKLHQLEATDVRPIYEARKQEVETLASLTATPQYVFQGDSANQSGNSADLAREQIVFAVEAMNDQASLALSQMQSLAFQAEGDTVRSNLEELEVLWAKVNPSTLSQRATAAADAKKGGATQRWIDEHALEMSPAERRLASQDRTDEAFLAVIAGGDTDGSTGTSTNAS